MEKTFLVRLVEIPKEFLVEETWWNHVQSDFSSDELARLKRFVRLEDRVRSAAGQLELRRFHSEPDLACRWARTSKGKPVLRPAGGTKAAPCDLSVSHDRHLLALASASSCVVGVDVAVVSAHSDPFVLSSVATALTGEEKLALTNCGSPLQQQRRFLRVWTAKEAVLKAIGVGLEIDPLLINVTDVSSSSPAAVQVRLDGQPQPQWRVAVAEYECHVMAVACLPVTAADPSLLDGLGWANGHTSQVPSEDQILSALCSLKPVPLS